jgi:hypothetical protein
MPSELVQTYDTLQDVDRLYVRSVCYTEKRPA